MTVKTYNFKDNTQLSEHFNVSEFRLICSLILSMFLEEHCFIRLLNPLISIVLANPFILICQITYCENSF